MQWFRLAPFINKEGGWRVASFRQSHSSALLGVHLLAVPLTENGIRSFFYACLEPQSKQQGASRTSSERPPFWVVMETRSAAHLCKWACESPSVSSPTCTRSQGDRVWSLATHTELHWSRTGYPFPEFSLPEDPRQRFASVKGTEDKHFLFLGENHYMCARTWAGRSGAVFFKLL